MSKICERDGCENLVPYPRRQYCSVECGRVANRQRGKLMDKPSVRVGGTLKPRTCLKCNKKFMSDGPWNRHCPKCKKLIERSPSAIPVAHRIPGADRHRVAALALQAEMENL